MAESLSLTVPVVPPTVSTYRVTSLTLNFGGQKISMELTGTNGEILIPPPIVGSTAVTLMVALNKANLSVKSLQRRILERLVADGVLAGTINGSPD
jgi:hypothetical protein